MALTSIPSNDDSIENVENVLMEGWLLKKPSHTIASKYWNDRYFTLRGQTLSYQVSKGDSAMKGSFKLVAGCTVGEIYSMEYKDRKSLIGHSSPKTGMSIDENNVEVKKHNGKHKEYKYCFKITWPESNDPRSIQPDPVYTNTTTVTNDINQTNPNIPRKNQQNALEKKVSSKSIFRPRLPHSISSKSLMASPKQGHDRRLTMDSIPNLNYLSGHKQYESNKSMKDESTPLLNGENPQSDLSRTYPQKIQQQKLVNVQSDEQMKALARAAKRASHKKTKRKMLQGGSVVAAAGAVATATILSAGLGLLMLGVSAGAAAGGSSALVSKSYSKQKNGYTLVLAASGQNIAAQWKAAVEDAIHRITTMESSAWTRFFAMEGRSASEFLIPTSKQPRPAGGKSPSDSDDKIEFRHTIAQTHWIPIDGGWSSTVSGLRIFREEKSNDNLAQKSRIQLSVKGRPCPPLKAQVILNASPLSAFMCLMSHPHIRFDENTADGIMSPASGQRASFRIIEQKDNNSDIIHLVFRPIHVFPFTTYPRDYCINRFWRFEDDGSYVICYDSVIHPDCPPFPHYVRGELNGVYSIAPRKRHATANATNMEECLLTHIVQVDPGGWIPTMHIPYWSTYANAEAFAVSSLLQMIDIKDALDQERFITVSLDDSPPTKYEDERLSQSKSTDSVEDDLIHYDFAYSGEVETQVRMMSEEQYTISNFPQPLLTTMWAEADANSFKVRGKHYKKDHKKFHAGKSILRLIAVDILRVKSIILSGFANHPKERIQQALAREAEMKKNGSNEESDMPPFVFLLNITLPGNPLHHMLFYFAVDDMSVIDGSNGTPFSKLANQFFFGDSDDFRDHTFKLIPQIVEGNFIVRRAVGSTPAIMGTKLKQHYIRGERFFELILDVGSSSVAAGVTGLASGYAKNLIIDMAFLLEGNDESTLPEKVMGCVRMKNVDLSNAPRFCESYESNGVN